MQAQKEAATTNKNVCPPRQVQSRCAKEDTAANGFNQSSSNAKKIIDIKHGEKMNQEVAVRRQEEFALIEQVVMQGDLSKLDAQQRVTYYRKVCESAGLNPFTNPFAYIHLNGKLTLYAKKDCTEQLRKINGVSIEGLDDKVIDDLYIVKAKAKDKHGRMDESTGAVFIGNLKGEAKANAIMKAETKAKRRVTLSICGMGWTDESEIDSIPNAARVEVDLSTGEIKGSKAPCVVQIQQKFSAAQAEEMMMILSECDEKYKEWVFDHLRKQYKTDNLCDLPADIFDRMKAAAVKNMEETFVRQRSGQVEVMEEAVQ